MARQTIIPVFDFANGRLEKGFRCTYPHPARGKGIQLLTRHSQAGRTHFVMIAQPLTSADSF